MDWSGLSWGMEGGTQAREAALWAQLQREFLRRNLLPKNAVRRLDAIGFQWHPEVRGRLEVVFARQHAGLVLQLMRVSMITVTTVIVINNCTSPVQGLGVCLACPVRPSLSTLPHDCTSTNRCMFLTSDENEAHKRQAVLCLGDLLILNLQLSLALTI